MWLGIMHDNTTRVISLQKIRVEQHIQSRLTDHHLHRHTPTLVISGVVVCFKSSLLYFLVMPGIEPGTSVPENIFSSVTYINFYFIIGVTSFQFFFLLWIKKNTPCHHHNHKGRNGRENRWVNTIMENPSSPPNQLIFNYYLQMQVLFLLCEYI